jgi:eukaryotic-like serine/threonine-protein kinase
VSVPSDNPRLVPGVILADRFRLGERIGYGGHGEIWSGTDLRSGQRVALKCLRPDLCNSAEAWAVLRHESMMVQRLSHPGVLRTEGPIRDGELTVLPMEFAGGGDLRRLRGQGYLRVVPVLIRIAEVLAHAHARDVVHRDLKPGNVLFDEAGGVRLADFGAAALCGETDASACGSPFSASPQQLRDEPAAPADDIYGLGALAYELLSGYPPFYPEFRREQVLSEPPAPLAPAQPVPPRLARLVLSMLAKEPQDRPRSMEAVVEELNQCLADTLATAIPAALPPAADDEDGERISAGPRGPLAPAAATARTPAPVVVPSALRRYAPVVALAAAVVAAVVILPRFAPDPVAPGTAPVAATGNAEGADGAAATGAGNGAASPPAMATAAATPEQRAAGARQARAEYGAALAGLEQREAGAWGGPAFAAARGRGDIAEREFQAGQFEAAEANFAGAAQALAALAGSAAAAASEEVRRGQSALAAGQVAVARAAFERALVIEPDTAAAKPGLEKVEAVEASLRQMAIAARAEASGDLASAELAYAQAVQLAPDFAPAREAQRELAASRAGTQFSQWLSAGHAALRAGRREEAEMLFRRAAALQPDNPAARDALAGLAVERAAGERSARLREAAALEAGERWGEAVTEYRRLLDEDPSLAAAQQGLARAEARASLDARLADYVARSSRLTAQAVNDAAQRALREARAVDEPGPRLQAQVRELDALLSQVREPVTVALSSDNSTEVSILRYGALGSFVSRELALPPGRYTVVGRRDGYRDVRHELQLAPGQKFVEVQVRCTERI